MMSQRERGVEAAGEGVARSAPAEARGWRRAGEEVRQGGRTKGFASGLYREAVSFNGRILY
jgi:hypothetical protein